MSAKLSRSQLISIKMQQYPYAKHASKLTRDELKILFDFASQNAELDRGAFELKVNRMFLGVEPKPRRWVIICELLTVANSAYFSQT